MGGATIDTNIPGLVTVETIAEAMTAGTIRAEGIGVRRERNDGMREKSARMIMHNNPSASADCRVAYLRTSRWGRNGLHHCGVAG